MQATNEGRHLNIMLISVHGLMRGEDPELGRDADTGGQIKYVLELARALSDDPKVRRVDLLTRLVRDSRIADGYAVPVEKIADRAFIIRLSCGPRRYLRKEALWSYLDVFVDQALQHIRGLGRVPDIIHGHYADGGYVGAQLARLLGVPFIFTGHSLGRIKKARLLEKGLAEERIEQRYNINTRIDAEEFALDIAGAVIASTQQEIDEQYRVYENYSARQMTVIPPGLDLGIFHPPHRGLFQPPVWQELKRFLANPRKPMVLAISRADERKNIETLIRAFAQNEDLRQQANLVLVAGNRDEIDRMERGTRKVLTGLLLLIDKYDLYGHIAYPKHHRPEDVPSLYRLAARTGGVFVNPALTEPFGLTLLEAAASGLPIVATEDGGPNDIIRKCRNGLLVNPLNAAQMGEAILTIIEDRYLWRRYSRSGLRGVERHFTWKGHVRSYLAKTRILMKKKYYSRNLMKRHVSKLPTAERIIISDIDNTLIGDEESLRQFMEIIESSSPKVGFGIATGRHIRGTVEVLKKWRIAPPEILITSVGSEIYYGPKLVKDVSWERHLNYHWKPERIRNLLKGKPGLKLQPPGNQRHYKISYYFDPDEAPARREIVKLLRREGLKAKVIYSHEAYLDILPIRASKGLAVRYLAMKWGMRPEQILVAGDSGNDEEMLSGDILGVVVGNYSAELEHLRDTPRVYFAESSHAGGILEGIDHYHFLSTNGDNQPVNGVIETEPVI